MSFGNVNSHIYNFDKGNDKLSTLHSAAGFGQSEGSLAAAAHLGLRNAGSASASTKAKSDSEVMPVMHDIEFIYLSGRQRFNM